MPASSLTTDMGPALCPYCSSVGTGRHMCDHIDAEHAKEISEVTYGVCLSGALVDNGEYEDPLAAMARALSVFRELEATDCEECVQVLVWKRE